MQDRPLKNRYPETIENLPSGILSCRFGDRDVTVTALSPRHLKIRLDADTPCDSDLFLFHCFFFEETGYQTFGPFRGIQAISAASGHSAQALSSPALLAAPFPSFMTEAVFEIEDPSFSDMVRKVTGQLHHYIFGQLNAVGNEFSETLTGYPSALDDVFAADYREWLSNRKKYLCAVSEWVKTQDLEIALSLETVSLCRSYLDDTLPTRLPFAGIYIGSPWCPNQFPELPLLLALLKKAASESKRVTLVLPWLRDSLAEKYTRILTAVLNCCRRHSILLEIEVNDLGWLSFFRSCFASEQELYALNYGRLLNKRRKDPRLIYKYPQLRPTSYPASDRKEASDRIFHENARCGTGDPKSPCRIAPTEIPEILGANSLNDEAYLAFLKKYGITRFEQEACGYPLQLPKAPQSLHLPLYQTNTSQYCPLMALLQHGDRGKQILQEHCSRPCEQQMLLYPEHLNLIGRYNSVFGLDMRILEIDMKAYKTSGVDRIVWNLWKPDQN